jgi:hypothetical protein
MGDDMLSTSRFKSVTILSSVFAVIVLFLSIYAFASTDIASLKFMSVIDITLDIFCIFSGIVLFISAVLDTPKKEDDFKFFLHMLLTNIVASFADEMSWIVDGQPQYIQANMAANTVYYLANLMMPFLFWKYVSSILRIAGKKFSKWTCLFDIGLFISAALIVLNVFTGIYFTVDPDGFYHRSPYFMASNIYIYLTLIITLIFVVIYRNLLRKYQLIAFFIYVFFPIGMGFFAVAIYGLTLTTASSCLVLLLMYCILHVKLSRERYVAANDLVTANAIQKNIIPAGSHAYPDRTDFDLYASMTTAKEVGGDFYDHFMADNDHLVIIISDVSGKSIPAALFMMVVKTMLNDRAHRSFRSVREVFNRVNNQLCEVNELDMFATAWLGVLELSTGRLSYSSAGHEYMALKKANGVFEIRKIDNLPPLAVIENIEYKDYEITLEPGDIIWLYTDGVPEALNLQREMYGIDRMIASLNRHCTGDIKDLDKGIREDIVFFSGGAEQADDITTLCLRYNGPAK